MVTKRRHQAETSRHGAAAVLRPRFMTSAMWYAWLLRRDVAPVLAIPDEEAQREFVVWWLLWGRGEYPAAWEWSSVQADAAMELVPIGRGLACPRLLRRLHASRTDLQHAFSLQDQESLVEYLLLVSRVWVAGTGRRSPASPSLHCHDGISQVAPTLVGGRPAGSLSRNYARCSLLEGRRRNQLCHSAPSR